MPRRTNSIRWIEQGRPSARPRACVAGFQVSAPMGRVEIALDVLELEA
jgi:hypothetical protein